MPNIPWSSVTLRVQDRCLLMRGRGCGGVVELFFASRSIGPTVGSVPGIEPAAVAALFERWLVVEGVPVLLDGLMRPVEPLSSWFRYLALAGRSPKTMRKYAYIGLRLVE